MRAIFVASRANLIPIQLRGPKPKGMWQSWGRLALSSAVNLGCRYVIYSKTMVRVKLNKSAIISMFPLWHCRLKALMVSEWHYNNIKVSALKNFSCWSLGIQDLPIRIKLFGIFPIKGIVMKQITRNYNNSTLWNCHSLDSGGLLTKTKSSVERLNSMWRNWKGKIYIPWGRRVKT